MRWFKWAARALGGALALVTLLFLAAGEGASGSQPTSAYAPPRRAEPAQKPMQVLREDVLCVLVANLSSGGGWGEFEPNMIFLLAIDEQGEISILNLPALTRVRLAQTGEGGLYRSTYGTLASAYRQEQADGRGAQGLMEAAQQILGGVPVQRCVLVSDPGLEALIDALGGVYVTDDYFSAQVGGYRDIEAMEAAPERGDYVLLTGAQTLAYTASPTGGMAVDVGALSRQNSILTSTLRRIAQKEVELAKIQQLCGGWFYSNLSEREAGLVAGALRMIGEQEDWKGPAEDLWGTDRMLGNQGYRLPDSARIKEYALETFYRWVE